MYFQIVVFQYNNIGNKLKQISIEKLKLQTILFGHVNDEYL